MGPIFYSDIAMSLLVSQPKFIHQSESLYLMSWWHLVNTECRYGGVSGFYLGIV